MPHHPILSIAGRITHVFGHRFVVETAKGAVLADLTPHGAEEITLRKGATVTLEGEMKPTELKVSRFTSGRTVVDIEHHKHHHHHHDHHHHEPADPAVVLESAREAGYETLGEPRRKPKHFEVLARRRGRLSELHIELDGHIRKAKPVEDDEPKWQMALRASRKPAMSAKSRTGSSPRSRPATRSVPAARRKRVKVKA